MRFLTEQEDEQISAGGLGVTVASIMAVICSAVVAVVIYRLFMSKKGSATLPGGWKFTWN